LVTSPENAPVALVGGTLIDGTGAEAVPDAVLLIQDRCIVGAGPRAEVTIPTNAQAIELHGATVLPGFIDAHVHNAYRPGNLQTWAQSGVTTVRDLGAPVGEPHFALRDRLRADPANARLVAAGPLVTVPRGYPIVPNGFPSLAVTSPEDARQQIDRLIDEGADVIKIAFSSRPPVLSAQEAAAIVETAHARGIPVTAHATNMPELQRALDAGVDDVAHIVGDRVPTRMIRRMVRMGVSWVPTMEALHGEGGDNLLRFLDMGGQVAMGTDAGYLEGLEIGLSLDEIGLMAEAGMTAMQIIVAATRNSARVCRLEHELGTLQAGKVADVWVVDGDPLQDLRALAKVRLVIHEGIVIHTAD
jgi:imidazolonepropionase-like amidohydrolase